MFYSSVSVSEQNYNKEVWAQLPIRDRNHSTSKLNCLFKSEIFVRHVRQCMDWDLVHNKNIFIHYGDKSNYTFFCAILKM